MIYTSEECGVERRGKKGGDEGEEREREREGEIYVNRFLLTRGHHHYHSP